ncbi:hypothetical protein J1N35_019353 [Gossypium stocksii]|uniref:DUF569 domain-containing protein n=1 Tax=Gossypium stocksii TaxID=47602 RepID=A0A9D4A822_9ROSI|nr:hypothetical protein J1N35_019353 [Gossypium stocksii]
MEIFEEASIVRFRSIHDKYLLAEDDEETVSQERGGTIRNARWTVEFVQFNSTHIRLKSCYGKYLTASNMPFLLGMTGKKVLQTLPQRLDSSVEWEPIQEGSRVRLKTRYGQYLRANGGIPPWRNHVTHDTPYRTSHQDWILWQVDILRFRHQDKLPAPPPPVQVQADEFDDSDTGSPPTISLRGSRMSKNEEDDSGNGSPKASEGRTIKYEVVDDNGDVDQNIGERKFIFKGNGVDDLKKALKEENVVKEEFSLCSRNPLNGNLYPLRLQLPPNNTAMHVVLVPLSSKGKQIQNWVSKNGVFSSDSYVQTGVIRLYVETKLWGDARKVFDEITFVDVVKWNVVMSGLIRCGLGTQALGLFKEMLVYGLEPDEFCLTTALTACAQSGNLWEGRWIHEYVKKRKNHLGLDVFTGTALVDMYAKCGCLDLAMEVFQGMTKRNVFSWAAMIGGFAVHGHAKEAIHYFEKMQTYGVRPDGVVLLSFLTACRHAGLAEEGLFLLNNMEHQYKIMPKHEHYSCVVDLLCRVGRFDEALKLIKRMPMKPLASVWGALLNGCRIHNNVELAELAVKELLEVEDWDKDEEDAALVQLSNIYFSSQKSEDGYRIRRMIGDRGLKKAPGCSMIEVDGRTTEFVSGDVSHPLHSQIHAILRLLFPEDPDTL